MLLFHSDTAGIHMVMMVVQSILGKMVPSLPLGKEAKEVSAQRKEHWQEEIISIKNIIILYY